MWVRTVDVKDLEARAKVSENRGKNSTSLSSDEGYGRGLREEIHLRTNQDEPNVGYFHHFH